MTKGTKKKPVDPKVENRIALVSVTINAADWMGILLRDAIVEKLQVETMKLLGRVDRGKFIVTKSYCNNCVTLIHCLHWMR